MTSRRPMTSYSGNGRFSSQNGDDVLSPRLDGCNYLSMSGLKTGYPVPELTWYKDDMELDRYCGLPKYEIFQNGKIHTLHIYNCTLDDAAIYQVSARNSKGIVSCSGVLEVGTMSEYKIHQRFFAKIKQKAEQKRRELEHNNCQEKATIYQEPVSSSQNNVRWIDGLSHNAYSSHIGKDNKAKVVEVSEEQPEASNEELNRITVKVHRYPMRADKSQENDSQYMTSGVKNENQQLIYDTENADVGSTTLSTKEKEISNITLSSGFGKVFGQDAEEGKEAHEGISLAKILVESLQLKLCEENQKTTHQLHQSTSNITITIQERKKKMDNDWERCSVQINKGQFVVKLAGNS
ncbi:Alpha-protein kinase 3 [Bagarius yarrelli]|uniref:non-specific serine/threonine protein kinase n=1 Tax=Bagarius yarrelli TaxID=175774 RepID=A0A556VB07_BAGYA|nr:Alpha-protein kinase 3 [Bagarius yarrelli]